MSYNGWPNRATWNVALWLNNDEGLYRQLQVIGRRYHERSALAQAIEEFCRAVWPSGTTPDGDSLNAADWDEIAGAELEEEEA